MDLKTLFNECPTYEDKLIQGCHMALLRNYPELILRWSRIYGKRWAYLYGETGAVGMPGLKVQLNNQYGLCMDNAEIIPADTLVEIIETLKEYFADEL